MTRTASIGSPSLSVIAMLSGITAIAGLPSLDEVIEEVIADELAEAKKAERQSLAEMKAAFTRAAQLRDQEYGVVRIKGKHGRVTHPYALRTNEKRKENGSTYTKVLIPYSEVELRNARDKFFVMSDNPKPHMRKGLHLPVRSHEQWVRDDRISKA